VGGTESDEECTTTQIRKEGIDTSPAVATVPEILLSITLPSFSISLFPSPYFLEYVQKGKAITDEGWQDGMLNGTMAPAFQGIVALVFSRDYGRVLVPFSHTANSPKVITFFLDPD
jgi:hypothetical protein